MRPRHAAGRSGQADKLVILHHVTDFDVDARQMSIQRIDAQTMIQDDRVPREKQILRQCNASAIRRMNRRSGCRTKIRSGVRSARLAVKNAPMAKISTGAPRDWSPEAFAPEHLA